MKKRNLHLDIVRILACVMVVLMHSPLPSSNNANGLLLSSLSYFTAPCIGLFFMVSGALLLPPPPEVTKHRQDGLEMGLNPGQCTTAVGSCALCTKTWGLLLTLK